MNERDILNELASKPIRSIDLKDSLTIRGFCGSMRTADRLIVKWISVGLLKKVSLDKRNYFVIYEQEDVESTPPE